MTTKESDCTFFKRIDYQNHSNAAYQKNTTEKLGCYEESSKKTLESSDKFGVDFQLVKTSNHTFVYPYNEKQPYIYTLFQRKSK